MAHSVILGGSESGKSLLAKGFVQDYSAAGIKTGVYDPLCSRDWKADFQTDKREVLLDKFWSSFNCAWFIDECNGLVTNWDFEVAELATKGRHFEKRNGIWVGGHNVHFIGQRLTQISVTARDQCSNLFLFNSSMEDGKRLASEWVKPELAQAHTLKAGEYFQVLTRFGKVEKKCLPHPWFRNKK